MEERLSKQRALYRGCLLGGACGDALGAKVEFMSDATSIFCKYGPSGIREIGTNYGVLGGVTDDTQMTLFTAEGVLSAALAFLRPGSSPPSSFLAELALPALHQAYLRWLHTQGSSSSSAVHGMAVREKSWLLKQEALHSSRAPGMTCMSSLMSSAVGTANNRINESKGCGGVMRVAPCGLIVHSAFPNLSPEEQTHLAFQLGCSAAAITHTHPSGWLSSGCLSSLILRTISGTSLKDAVEVTVALLRQELDHEETLEKIEQARQLAQDFTHKTSTMRNAQGLDDINKQKLALKHIEQIGEGWVGEEALAIALYCCLICRRSSDFEAAVRYSVNHGGDSDSTGAIAGNILGAMFGDTAIPQQWRTVVELKDVIIQVSDDMCDILDPENWIRLGSNYVPPILTRDGVPLYLLEPLC